MKFYLYVVLSILVLNIQASYLQKKRYDDSSSSDDDDRTFAAHQRAGPETAVATKPKDEEVVIKDPTRISIFNSGEYSVAIILNFILDDLQAEDISHHDVGSGAHRDMFLPRIATNIRIRVILDGISSDETIVDWQIYTLKDREVLCLLLAGGRLNPVYGKCGLPFYKMLKAWRA